MDEVAHTKDGSTQWGIGIRSGSFKTILLHKENAESGSRMTQNMSNIKDVTPFADLIIYGVPVYGAPGAPHGADAIALGDGKVLAIGDMEAIKRYQGSTTMMFRRDLGCVIPGLIDGHAHMDREGLKGILPSLEGADTKETIVERVREEVTRKQPGEWIVTMPIGTPPNYEEMGNEETGTFDEHWYPNRLDLDKVSPENPVYIRPIWGYWSSRLPLVSIANSRALELAGIDRNTEPPSGDVDIVKDPATGEPTGVFLENTKMPIVELTLLDCAPNFTLSNRVAALKRSMNIYNSFGTTGVYEGHGAASDVITAYQTLYDQGHQTVRATLVLSPAWASVGDTEPAALLRDWFRWLSRRGFGNEHLRFEGLYAEIDEAGANWVRAGASPQTGWAGFHYDSGLPRQALKDLLLEAVRCGMRVSCIFADVAELYAEVHREVPIDGLRWSWGHISTLNSDDIARARDLGLVLVTHTNRHIRKMGSAHRCRLGAENENQIVPLRSLLDAGVPVAFGTDNLPPSLFQPIYHAVVRRDELTGETVAPEQKLTREEALRCASWGGAYLKGQEDLTGTLEPGKGADLVVLNDDYMGISEEGIPNLHADITIVNGRIVFNRTGEKILPETESRLRREIKKA